MKFLHAIAWTWAVLSTLTVLYWGTGHEFFSSSAFNYIYGAYVSIFQAGGNMIHSSGSQNYAEAWSMNKIG